MKKRHEEKERQRLIDDLKNDKDNLNRKRERVLSACGMRSNNNNGLEGTFFYKFSISKEESLRKAINSNDTISQQKGAKLHVASNEQQELASKASST